MKIRNKDEESNETSTTTGIILLVVSILIFQLWANIVGISPAPSFVFGGEVLKKLLEGEEIPPSSTSLSLYLLLPLSCMSAAFWLVIRYVSLRLHLGRN